MLFGDDGGDFDRGDVVWGRFFGSEGGFGFATKNVAMYNVGVFTHAVLWLWSRNPRGLCDRLPNNVDNDSVRTFL